MKNRPLAQMDAHGADEGKQQHAAGEVLHGERRLGLLLMLGFSPHSTSTFNSAPAR